MTTTTKRSQAEAKSKPALQVQVGGIRIPIWKNEGKDGPYYKAGQPELSYKGADGKWYAGKSFGPRDLVNLIKAAALAHSEVIQRNRAEKPAADDYEDTDSEEQAA